MAARWSTPAAATAPHYADGTGDVDAEGVMWRPDGIYVSAEWNLTADLPAVAANSGLEAITWVPDSHLTAHGFTDQRTGAANDPAGYPGRGDGLFLVGLEAGGDLILGRGGNDVVAGGGGADCVATDPGNDVIITTGGGDRIDAGGGNNVVDAGAGTNTGGRCEMFGR
jgi:hypothetical protein